MAVNNLIDIIADIDKKNIDYRFLISPCSIMKFLFWSIIQFKIRPWHYYYYFFSVTDDRNTFFFSPNPKDVVDIIQIDGSFYA